MKEQDGGDWAKSGVVWGGGWAVDVDERAGPSAPRPKLFELRLAPAPPRLTHGVVACC